MPDISSRYSETISMQEAVLFIDLKLRFFEVVSCLNSDMLGLFFDGITMFDLLCTRHFLKVAGKGEKDSPTLPVYKEQAHFYNYFFKYMLNGVSDKNVIVTGHEYYHIDDESKIHSIQPLITGNKILFKLPAMFEEVWYLERKEQAGVVKRILHYNKWKKVIATSLILHGDGKIEDPTYQRIIEESKK